MQHYNREKAHNVQFHRQSVRSNGEPVWPILAWPSQAVTAICPPLHTNHWIKRFHNAPLGLAIYTSLGWHHRRPSVKMLRVLIWDVPLSSPVITTCNTALKMRFSSHTASRPVTAYRLACEKYQSLTCTTIAWCDRKGSGKTHCCCRSTALHPSSIRGHWTQVCFAITCNPVPRSATVLGPTEVCVHLVIWRLVCVHVRAYVFSQLHYMLHSRPTPLCGMIGWSRVFWWMGHCSSVYLCSSALLRNILHNFIKNETGLELVFFASVEHFFAAYITLIRKDYIGRLGSAEDRGIVSLSSGYIRVDDRGAPTSAHPSISCWTVSFLSKWKHLLWCPCVSSPV